MKTRAWIARIWLGTLLMVVVCLAWVRESGSLGHLLADLLLVAGLLLFFVETLPGPPPSRNHGREGRLYPIGLALALIGTALKLMVW